MDSSPQPQLLRPPQQLNPPRLLLLRPPQLPSPPQLQLLRPPQQLNPPQLQLQRPPAPPQVWPRFILFSLFVFYFFSTKK
jgi:hypothetical protein